MDLEGMEHGPYTLNIVCLSVMNTHSDLCLLCVEGTNPKHASAPTVLQQLTYAFYHVQ